MNSLSKISFLLFAVSSSFIISSCDKVAELFKVDLKVRDTIEFIIPATTITSIDKTETIWFNVDSFIKASTNDVANISNLKSARIKAASLLLDGEETKDFRLFKRVSVSVVSDNNSSPFTLTVNNLMNATKVLNLPINPNEDLKAYFNSNSFTYRLQADLKDGSVTFDKDTPCELAIEYQLSIEK